MKTKKASSQSPSPAKKKQKTSQGTEVRVDNKAKGTPFEYEPNNPLVSLPPDALTAVLCRSPSSDHDALWRSCKTIRSTLNSAAFTSERVATGYAEVSVRHITKEELWYNAYGMDEEHDPASEEYDAEKSARMKEEEMERFSELGCYDESYGYHDIKFEVMVDGRRRGSIDLVLFPNRGRLFLEATDAHSRELQEVACTLCDKWGRPKLKSIRDADLDRAAERGAFLHVVRVRVSEACHPSDDTDVPSKALRMAITHPKLQGTWTLAGGISDADVYFTKTNADAITVEDFPRPKRREECMLLDSRTYLRVGYQQIPELLGPEARTNWFFALPRFLKGALLSDAEASMGLLKCPELPPEPVGANKKLLDLLMRGACCVRRFELDDSHRETISFAKKIDEVRTIVSSTRRETEGQEERGNIRISRIDELLQSYRGRATGLGDATRHQIKELEKEKEEAEAVMKVCEEKKKAINEVEAKFIEILSKRKTKIAEIDAKNLEREKEFVQQVISLIKDDEASIRKAFVLHCFRLNVLFDALFDLVPANERKAAINEVDFGGCTPLFTAAQSVPDDIAQATEQYKFVEKLLKLGADKNYVDFKGLTALGMYRTTLQSVDISTALLNSHWRDEEDDDADWDPIHVRMEDLLMPAGGETEADRNAKKLPAPYFWDEDEEDSDEEEEGIADGEEQDDGEDSDGEDDEGSDGED